MDADTIWHGKNDDEVLAAYHQLADFTDEGRSILKAEVERRGLTVAAPVLIDSAAKPESDPLPSAPFARLWAGGYSLPLSYWGWGIGGRILWQFASGVILVSVPASLVLATSLALLFASLTYAVVVCVGIWRSADRYAGRPVWAVLAKVAVAANAAASTMQLIFVLFGPR